MLTKVVVDLWPVVYYMVILFIILTIFSYIFLFKRYKKRNNIIENINKANHSDLRNQLNALSLCKFPKVLAWEKELNDFYIAIIYLFDGNFLEFNNIINSIKSSRINYLKQTWLAMSEYLQDNFAEFTKYYDFFN